ncbi:GNAT family N-acetyltransferase [Streptomyces sp. H27-D2]|uniref:GNAT family N-acetyltransferase n=1 Tax=Streptomyces sp. H27-D2 TaxID=3046304 RepID=UPI002DBE7EA0|nr:GNAT family N-acetyltransferase [Streptomyces sp. H27-D2]MEC4020127.1 GNAT family N-acetyltransferase [Streptomyces sp. H27-D2]
MFRIEEEIDQQRRDLISQRLHDSNSERSEVLRALRGTVADEEIPLQVYAVDDEGELAAGLIGYTWGRWLHVDLLWVDAGRRGTKLGSRLVARAEEIARDERDCRYSRVETWDFQAPLFYQKLGYTIVSQVHDYPPGATDHLLTKPLSPGTDG